MIEGGIGRTCKDRRRVEGEGCPPIGERPTIEVVVSRLQREALAAEDRAGAIHKLLSAANQLIVAADRISTMDSTAIDEPEDRAIPLTRARRPEVVDDHGRLARIMYRTRRKRDELFEDPSLFGEPAWDILIEAFFVAESGKQMSVSHACQAASVPPTTALRWVQLLEKRGLLERANDPLDGRRSFVRLSAEGYRKMATYFETVTALWR